MRRFRMPGKLTQRDRLSVGLPMPRPLRFPEWVTVEVDRLKKSLLRVKKPEGKRHLRIKTFKP